MKESGLPQWRGRGIRAITVFLLVGFLSCLTLTGEANPAKPITTDVLIDVGHGGIDGGTVYGNILEKNINLQVASKLQRRLQEAGLTALLTRDRDYALSDDYRTHKTGRHRRDLIQRKRIADTLTPRLMLSMHANWSTDERKYGPLVIHQNNRHSMLLAAAIQGTLNELYHTQGRKPELGKTLFLLNHVDCPTVIVEAGYLSNASDRMILTQPDNQERLAATIGKAVLLYLKQAD